MSVPEQPRQPCLKTAECNYDYCYVETEDPAEKDVGAKGKTTHIWIHSTMP